MGDDYVLLERTDDEFTDALPPGTRELYSASELEDIEEFLSLKIGFRRE